MLSRRCASSARPFRLLSKAADASPNRGRPAVQIMGVAPRHQGVPRFHQPIKETKTFPFHKARHIALEYQLIKGEQGLIIGLCIPGEIPLDMGQQRHNIQGIGQVLQLLQHPGTVARHRQFQKQQAGALYAQGPQVLFPYPPHQPHLGTKAGLG